MKNIAVIGAGYWGKNLVRNFSQLEVLKSVCDQDHDIRSKLSKDYPEVTVTDDFDAVLNDTDIVGVVISAPAALHFDLARKALMADKHVFVEKPLALTYQDGKGLVELAEARQKILFVGHILHYHPAVVKLKELINSGSIGRIEYIYSRRLSLGKIRREENILWSFAPHDISIILSLVGEDPYYVDSVGSNFLHARIADITMTNLKFPSGIGAHIFVSWLNPFKEQRLVVVGSRGMLMFDDTKPVEEKLVLYPHTINWKNGMPVPEKAESNAIDISQSWEEPLKAECRAFLSAMDTGFKPITSGDEGLRVLRILEISQKSVEQKEFTTYSSLGGNGGKSWYENETKADTERNSIYQSAIQNPKAAIDLRQSLSDDSVFIHPTAVIDDQVVFGHGSRIWLFSHVLPGSRIGQNCNIGQNVAIGPDVTVGNNCKIQNNVSVYKGVNLEDGVFCGPSMVFTNVYSPRAEIRKMDQVKPTLVKMGATLGANCTIICGLTIGRYAFIGAGAVVTKDVSDHALVVGNAGKQIGWVCECGERLTDDLRCVVCGKSYKKCDSGITKMVSEGLKR